MLATLTKPALDVGIVTQNADPVLAFYRDALGFEQREGLEIPGVGAIHKLAWGDSILRVMVPDTPPEADTSQGFATRCGLRYMTLEVSDARALTEAARTGGGKVLIEPFELRPGRVVSQVADPDGNTIELGQGEG